MKFKINTRQLVNTSCNVILTAVLGEIVNETIKTVKRKVKSIKRNETKEAQ